MTPKEKALADFKRRLEGYRDDPVGFARDILGVDPHPGQVKWLENATSRENALTAGNRFGKCLAEGTMVRMSDGSERAIQDIRVGEWVVGVNLDGSTAPARVTAVHDNGVRPTYEHRFSKRRTEASFRSTVDHKMLARTEQASLNATPRLGKGVRGPSWRRLPRGYRIVPASDLRERRWTAPRAHGFEAETSGPDEDLATFFGLMLGDGCCTRPPRPMQFTCADPDILALAEGSVAHYGYRMRSHASNPIQFYPSYISGPFKNGDNGGPLRAKLREYGMDGLYAHEKSIPDVCFTWSNNAVARLVGALVLTDGFVSLRGKNYGENGQVGFATTARPLVEGLKALLEQRFGVYGSTITEKDRGGRHKRTEYGFTVGAYADLVRFAAAVPLVGRKKRALDALLENWAGKKSDSAELQFRGSTYVGDHPTYDVTVDNETHLFALANGLVVSNSYASALRLIHRCVYRKGWTEDIARVAANNGQTYEAMNISITAYQARIVWDTVRALLSKPKAAWLIDPGKGKGIVMAPFPTIHFVTGARLQARSTGGSGERLLGVPLDHITWDECAFEKHFKQVRDNVLRMRMVDRAGTIDYVSTGNGRNEYGEYFLSGLPGPRKNPALYSQTGSSFENPTIDRASLEAAVALMPPHMRAQNIDGGIIEGGGGFFSLEDLQAAHDPKLDDMLVVHAIDAEGEVSHAELFFGKKPDDTTGGVRWYDKYPNHKYLHAWDLADKQDYTVGLTYDISTSPFTLVEFERVRRIGWHPIFGRMNARHKRYGSVPRTTKFDATGIGDVVRDDLIALFPDMRAEGVNFAGGRKDEMLTHLQTSLSLREVTWPHILPFFNEHAYYERDDKKLKTDCVMANGVFMYFAKRGRATSWSFGTVSTERAVPKRMAVEPNVLRAPREPANETASATAAEAPKAPAVVIVAPR